MTQYTKNNLTQKLNAVADMFYQAGFKDGHTQGVLETLTGDDVTNYQAIKNMSEDEMAQFLDDIAHYDNPEYEGWKSNLTPLLPFEDWRDWLGRKAVYGKEDTNG